MVRFLRVTHGPAATPPAGPPREEQGLQGPSALGGPRSLLANNTKCEWSLVIKAASPTCPASPRSLGLGHRSARLWSHQALLPTFPRSPGPARHPQEGGRAHRLQAFLCSPVATPGHSQARVTRSGLGLVAGRYLHLCWAHWDPRSRRLQEHLGHPGDRGAPAHPWEAGVWEEPRGQGCRRPSTARH